jgi:hypothetical protein
MPFFGQENFHQIIKESVWLNNAPLVPVRLDARRRRGADGFLDLIGNIRGASRSSLKPRSFPAYMTT